MSLTSVAVVAAIALFAPLGLSLSGLKFPSIALEIVLGIIVGPQVLGWAQADEPVSVLSLLGLAFLLLLAGLEIDFKQLRGPVVALTGFGFVASFALALAVGYGLWAGDLVRSPLLIAIILSATALGVIMPILKDSGETASAFGQLIVTAAAIAEIVPIVLLSLFFTGEAGGIGAKLVLLVVFLGFVAAVAGAIFGVERSKRISAALVRLQDTTAEIRVRGAFLLLVVFAVMATRFGLEAILGAYLAGATLTLVDRDALGTHALFRSKLQAVGFGVFIPFFFVSTGLQLDVRSLFQSGSTLLRVAVFLAAILAVRGIPALLYRSFAQRPRQLLGAGFLQATSLSLPVVAGKIGVTLGLIRPQNYVALVAAGLLSVLVFPLLGLMFLRQRPERPAVGAEGQHVMPLSPKRSLGAVAGPSIVVDQGGTT